MKLFCPSCGIHFPQDFPLTLKFSTCQFWSHKNLGFLDPEGKKLIWDWLIAMPADAISIKYKTGIAFEIGGFPISEEMTFKDRVPGWEKMTEQQKQDYERDYFKDLSKTDKIKYKKAKT